MEDYMLFGDRVLIKLDEVENDTIENSGFIVKLSINDNPNPARKATVIKIPSGGPSWVNPGDTIYIEAFSSRPIRIDKEDYHIVNKKDIIMKKKSN